MRNGVFWLSMTVAALLLGATGMLSTTRVAQAAPGDICQMVVWDSTGQVLNDGDVVDGNGKFYALARVEDDAFGFVGDFLQDSIAHDLLNQEITDLQDRIDEIQTRLDEIDTALNDDPTSQEKADLLNEQTVLQDEQSNLEEILLEIEEALQKFGDYNLAQVDAQTGAARIRSYAEVGTFEGIKPAVYQRLIAAPGVASQKIDHMFPDYFTDPDGNDLDSIRAWLSDVAGVSVPSAISDASSVCGNTNVRDGWKFVGLTCIEPGSFNFSISSHQKNASSGTLSQTIRLICPGQVDTATLSISPTTLETQPVGSSASASVVMVTAYDQSGNNVDGAEVQFLTNTCTFSNPLQDASNDLGMSPAGGGSVVTMYTDTDSVADSNFLANNPLQTVAGTAEAMLNCNKGAPGTVTVRAIVTRPGADINLTQDVKLVGPTSSTGLGLTLSDSSLECGEILTADATAVDVNGQPVSNGTTIYFTTDTSTGIVNGKEGGQGSNITVNGKTSVTVAMAPNDPGVHTLIAYTRDASGALLSQTSQHFECTSAVAPAVPTVVPPATGTGTGSITPPNTGDAGLAASAGNAYFLSALVAGAITVIITLIGLRAMRIASTGRRR